MGMNLIKTLDNPSQNYFIEVLEDVPGGLNFDVTELKATTTYVDAGTIVSIDELNRKCNIVKTAVMQAAATNVATVYQVNKNHELKVGDILAKTVGGAAYAITSIDTSNGSYDAVTLGTTLGVTCATGDVLFVSSAAGAAAGAFKYKAAGIVKNGFAVAPNSSASVVIRGSVYQRRLPFGVHSQMITDITPRIYFSQSY